MTYRVFGSDFLHRHGQWDEADGRLRWTVCGIRSFAFQPWPKGVARPPLTRCPK